MAENPNQSYSPDIDDVHDLATDPAAAEKGGSPGVSFKESFGALVDRTASSRSLRDQRKAHSELSQRITDDQAILEDNRYILANFDSEVAKQTDIVKKNNAALDKENKTYADLERTLKSQKNDLSRMQKEHAGTQKTYEAKRDGAKDTLNAAKRKVSTVQNELNKAEKALADLQRKRADSQVAMETAADAGTRDKAASEISALAGQVESAQGGIQSWEQKLADANAERTAAQAAFEGANRAYKDITDRQDDEEKALEKKIKTTSKQMEESKERAGQLKEVIQTATERIAYCKNVKNDPAATDRLAAQIESNRNHASVMEDDILDMEEQHNALKKRSRKAVAIIVAAILVIAAIVAAILLWPPFGESPERADTAADNPPAATQTTTNSNRDDAVDADEETSSIDTDAADTDNNAADTNNDAAGTDNDAGDTQGEEQSNGSQGERTARNS